MSQKPETRFRKRFVEKLKTISNLHVLSIQQLAIVGTPDLIICANGHFVALELKKDEKSEAPDIQLHVLKKLQEAGGTALVCYPENQEQVLQRIRTLCEATTNKGVQGNDRI